MREHRLTDDDDGATVAAAVGDTIVVALTETATTGYRWEPDLDPAALRVVGAEPAAPAEPRGAPGRRLITLEVLRPGRTRLRLLHKRSWERDPIGTFTAHVEARTG